MRPLRLCLLAALAAVANPAFATDYAAIERTCREASGPLNNSVVMGCADQASEAMKKDMNRLYQKTWVLLNAQDEVHATGFETAQKAWLQYREAWCDSQGMSIGTPMYSVCRMELNERRIGELQGFYQQVQGN